jgi:hypothetical protein
MFVIMGHRDRPNLRAQRGQGAESESGVEAAAKQYRIGDAFPHTPGDGLGE